MNEIIVNLEGKEYQIDIEKAKDLGILKEKDTRCKSWKEFKLKCRGSKGYYMDSLTGEIYNPVNPLGTGEQLTQQEAIAIQAFSKLLKLRRDWIGTWEPNWYIAEDKYCIVVKDTHINVGCFSAIQHTFSFPTREMAEEFLKCFKDLFEQCKNLI
jgi:hypothetical protein